MVDSGKGNEDASPKQDITVSLIFGSERHSIETSLDEKIEDFKKKVQALTDIPPSMQKLTCKGMMQDGRTLGECKVSNGCKILLIGCKPADVVQVNTKPSLKDQIQMQQKIKKESWCKMKEHKKILEKGIPKDVMVGIKNINDPLPHVPITGMVNKYGAKVMLSFKLETDQVVIGTNERTDKYNMSQVRNVVSVPIEDHEDYHIIALQLGPTEQSNYYLYWFPSQYVEALKNTIVGAL